VALIRPGHEDILSQLVQQLSLWATQKHLDTVSIRTPTRYHRAYQALLGLGFRIFHGELRMTLAGCHEQAAPEHFYLSKWE
jgi:hypothetical protein